MAGNTPSKGRSCCFYGCLGLVLFVILGGLGLYFGARYAINAVINLYTDTQPIAIPQAPMAAEDLDLLNRRVAQFQVALESHLATEPLILSASDINALIASSPAWAAVKDKLYVQIEGNQIKGRVSIPLEGVGISRLKGRYLNGAAALQVSLTNGILSIALNSIEVKGISIAGRALGEVQKVNLAAESVRDPNVARTIQALDSLEAKDGRLVITPKTNP